MIILSKFTNARIELKKEKTKEIEMEKTIKIQSLLKDRETIQASFNYFKKLDNEIYAFECIVDFSTMLKLMRMSESEYFRTPILNDEEKREFKNIHTFVIVGNYFTKDNIIYVEEIKFNNKAGIVIFDSFDIDNVEITNLDEIQVVNSTCAQQ